MIKNNWSYDLYDSDNGWGMGVGAKNQNDGDVCTLAEIFKKKMMKKAKKKKRKKMMMKLKLLMS